MNDSTPMIHELERRYAGAGRSVVPAAPSMAFLASVLEDYCDEWLTKAMFHYRWTYDIETAGFGIASQSGFGVPPAQREKAGEFMAARQVERLRTVVGSDTSKSRGAAFSIRARTRCLALTTGPP